MKTITNLSLVTFLVCLSGLAAYSQARSIKSVPEDAVYHSAEDGFNISLPADMVQKSAKKVSGNDRRMFIWEFSDAVMAVGVETRAKAVKTDADVAAIVGEYKSGIPKDNRVTLDFNKAYSPPCAFSEFTVCPLPPPQNHLDVAIEAGEKKYEP